MNIDIFGVGYVGLTLGLALAKQGVNVVGKDIDRKKLDALKNGTTDIKEPQIQSLLGQALDEGRIMFTSDLGRKPSDTEIAIVTIGTSLKNGSIVDSNEKLMSLVKQIDKLKYNYIYLRSTVGVGTCKKLSEVLITLKLFFVLSELLKAMQSKSRKSLPQILASPSKRALSSAAQLFSILGVELHLTNNFAEGEMAKLICNVYRDYKFAFANEIGLLCGELGLDARKLISLASKDYSRFRFKALAQFLAPVLQKIRLF